MFRFLSMLLLIVGSAQANPLTEKDVQSFIQVLEAMDAYEQENQDIDLDFDLDMEDGNLNDGMDMMLSENGEVVLMSSLAKQMNQHPQAGGDFRRAVKNAGFSDVSAFGEVGDQLFAAMMRAEMSKAELNEMRQASQMSEAELAYVPAQMRPMLKRMSALADTIQAVPESDVALAKKYKPRLDALGDKN
jgi:hypothetical protein